jgi:CheY-like chemotaxis protein
MSLVRNPVASVASTNANAPIHILVVDDEAALRAILREGLEAEGFAVSEARDKATLLRSLGTEPVDLITLDLGLGGEDGLELARQIRAVRNIPIVMITGRGAPIDRVAGLEHGADDTSRSPSISGRSYCAFTMSCGVTSSKKAYQSRAQRSGTHSISASWILRNAR